MAKSPQIWAIGGGKGGTGKTLISSQLAIHLASLGQQVILVDGDFCAPNIHFFSGIKKTEKSILDFFYEDEELENLIQETRIKNLRVITGDQNALSCNDINQKQKTRFLKNLRKLNASTVLLDLGSGSNATMIDFFLGADKKIVVTDLEIISLDNLFHFITNASLRKLNYSFANYGLSTTLPKLWKNREQYKIKSIQDLIRHLNEISNLKDKPSFRKSLHLKIHLIINKVRKANDIIEGFAVKSVCLKYLGAEALYSGYLEYDNQLWKNFSLVPSEKFTISPRIEQEMGTIAENINTGNQIRIDRIKNV
jgi:flagellar biosynthesis protein FlhG